LFPLLWSCQRTRYFTHVLYRGYSTISGVCESRIPLSLLTYAVQTTLPAAASDCTVQSLQVRRPVPPAPGAAGVRDCWVRHRDYRHYNPKRAGRLGKLTGPIFSIWYYREEISRGPAKVQFKRRCRPRQSHGRGPRRKFRPCVLEALVRMQDEAILHSFQSHPERVSVSRWFVLYNRYCT
jgi:hypothetical protein